MMSAMEATEHIAALQRDGEQLAAAAEQAGLDAAVPSCAPWRVADLLRHIGYVHQWAAGYIIERHTKFQPGRSSEAELLTAGPADADLLGWYRAGHARLVTALTEAHPELACWYFLPAPSPRAFWARRQAHETAIHRADAELAGGQMTPFRADFAHDGVDELIIGFFGRNGKRLTDGQRATGRRTLQVRATDTGGAWHVALTEDAKPSAAVQRGASPGETDCTLTGPAAGLYLLLWNRADPVTAGVEVDGDRDVLAAWQRGMRVTWE
jgi:uncharacterized protein (TIGR03083 family)